MLPKTLTLQPVVQGDLWKGGIPQILITEGPTGGPYAPPAAALSLVEMVFKKADGSVAETVTLSSADDEITINDAAEWDITIPEQVLPLTSGRWDWQIKCTAAGADGPLTYLEGQILIKPTL